MIAYPKTPLERLLWAYQFGHAWNRDPRYANLRNLDRGRILLMNGDEADAKLLIASWQDFEPNVERLVAAYHGRILQPDGDVGPATEFAMAIKRCAMPDFAPPPGVQLAVELPDLPDDLVKAFESYQRYAEAMNNGAEYVGGSGSWPKGCNAEHPNLHSTLVNVVTTSASDHQKEQLKDVLAGVERCEAEIGQLVIHRLDGSTSDCDHDVRYQYIAGGVIGYNYFPTPGVCRQRLVGRLDNSFNVGPMTMAELNTHEYKGHGDGSEHKSRTAARKSIMHPSIGSPTSYPTWIGDASEAEKKRWFGGVPIPTAPTPGPDPVPTPTQRVMIRNAKGLEVAQEVVALRDFAAKQGDVLGQFYYKSA